MIRTVKYKIWLFSCWLAEILYPVLKQFSVEARRQIGLTLVILAIGIPVNVYIFSSTTDSAVAAEKSGEFQRPLLLAELQGDPGALFENNLNREESTIVDQSGFDAVAPESAPVAELQPESAPAVSNLNTLDPPPAPAPLLQDKPSDTALEHAQKHQDPTYVCPMHPDVTSKDPDATCPICGMDLVLLENNGEAGIVQLSPTVINTLGVRTNLVKRRNIYRRISSVGYVSFDENKIRAISLRTDGWVEKLYVKSVGDHVKKGDILFEVFSPELVNAQEEYIQALDHDTPDGSLTFATYDRLLSLGFSDLQIEKLHTSKKVEQLLAFYAPQDGVVSDLKIREGMAVKPSTPIVSLADMSTVWVIANVFESQSDWIKEGLAVEARLAFQPGNLWSGVVDYIYPTVDPETRSVKVRMRFDNLDESLKPNMYADVAIFADPKRKVLTVPSEAVIRVGNQVRVILALGQGKFKPVVIHPGIETDDKVEIIGGLEEGQEVVVSSQFLIDSESSMRAALLRMAGN